MEKICSKCQIKKSIDDFGFSRPRVHRSECKKCQATYNRKYRKKNKFKVRQWAVNRIEKNKIYRTNNKEKRNSYLREWQKNNSGKVRSQRYRHRYGIEVEDYNKMLQDQKYCCAICRSKDLRRKNTQFFAVDHCHKTGVVRGLLCYSCNTLIGRAKDDINILFSAIRYLSIKEDLKQQDE